MKYRNSISPNSEDKNSVTDKQINKKVLRFGSFRKWSVVNLLVWFVCLFCLSFVPLVKYFSEKLRKSDSFFDFIDSWPKGESDNQKSYSQERYSIFNFAIIMNIFVGIWVLMWINFCKINFPKFCSVFVPKMNPRWESVKDLLVILNPHKICWVDLWQWIIAWYTRERGLP